MDNLLNTGLQIIQWLQSVGAWLTPVMQLFTFLGNVQFYLIVAPAILWCLDASLGVRVGIFLMVNGMVNSALKVVFHGPRPYWYSSQVKVMAAAENSFGAPSGHAQNAVVVWGGLARYIKGRVAWVIAILLMLFIGLSRIYLAVHFPHDVLLGWVFGILMLWLMVVLEKPVVTWMKKLSIGVQVLVVFIFSLLLILLVVVAQLSLGNWTVPPQWVSNAHLAFPEEPPITPLSINNIMPNAGAFFGLAAGWIWVTGLGGFTTRDLWFKLVLRYLLGLVGVLVLYEGLGLLFSESDSVLSYILGYVQYVLIGFWISGFAPWLFVKLRLASRKNI